jgi:hypothetical protein
MHDSSAKVPELPLSTFKELCALATEYHQLAPWKYLSDSDMLAIVDPATRKLRLVSVMGNGGEVFGLIVHRGERGLRWAITLAFDQTGEDTEDPNFTFSRDGLVVEFVPRKRLDKSDIDRFKQMGFKPLRDSEKRQVWPLFHSIRPGIYPAPLTIDEAELLLADLRKTINFVRLAGKDPRILRNEHGLVAFYPSDPKFTGPLRTQDIEWRELTLGPETWPEPLKLSRQEIKELKALPVDENLSMELDCLYSPGMVAGDPYPYLPWLSIAADGRTGRILDMLLTDSRTEPAEREAARGLVRTIRKLGVRPKEVGVRRTGIEFGLSSICQVLGILLIKVPCLPMTERAYAELNYHWKEVEEGLR